MFVICDVKIICIYILRKRSYCQHPMIAYYGSQNEQYVILRKMNYCQYSMIVYQESQSGQSVILRKMNYYQHTIARTQYNLLAVKSRILLAYFFDRQRHK